MKTNFKILAIILMTLFTIWIVGCKTTETEDISPEPEKTFSENKIP